MGSRATPPAPDCTPGAQVLKSHPKVLPVLESLRTSHSPCYCDPTEFDMADHASIPWRARTSSRGRPFVPLLEMSTSGKSRRVWWILFGEMEVLERHAPANGEKKEKKSKKLKKGRGEIGAQKGQSSDQPIGQVSAALAHLRHRTHPRPCISHSPQSINGCVHWLRRHSLKDSLR